MYGINKYWFVIALIFMAMLSNAQTISGKLSFLANQEIALEGFNGLQTYAIATTKIDANGNLNLLMPAPISAFVGVLHQQILG